MGNKERVLHYLVSIAPQAATNSQIRKTTGVEPHQQVYQLTRKLMDAGLISGEKQGREWFFWVGEADRIPPPAVTARSPGHITPSQFEAWAGRVLSARCQVPLMPRSVGHIPKQFDFVSPDGRIVGDAKYYTRGGTPSGKLATISEHVWLLGKTGAAETFLVFGNDRRVPIMWLERYGTLLSGITFYFLTDNGDLEELINPPSEGG